MDKFLTAFKHNSRINLVFLMLGVLIVLFALSLGWALMLPYVFFVYFPTMLYAIIKRQGRTKVLILLALGVVCLVLTMNSIFISMDIEDGFIKEPTGLLETILYQYSYFLIVPFYLLPLISARILFYKQKGTPS